MKEASIVFKLWLKMQFRRVETLGGRGRIVKVGWVTLGFEVAGLRGKVQERKEGRNESMNRPLGST